MNTSLNTNLIYVLFSLYVAGFNLTVWWTNINVGVCSWEKCKEHTLMFAFRFIYILKTTSICLTEDHFSLLSLKMSVHTMNHKETNPNAFKDQYSELFTSFLCMLRIIYPRVFKLNKSHLQSIIWQKVRGCYCYFSFPKLSEFVHSGF